MCTTLVACFISNLWKGLSPARTPDWPFSCWKNEMAWRVFACAPKWSWSLYLLPYYLLIKARFTLLLNKHSSAVAWICQTFFHSVVWVRNNVRVKRVKLKTFQVSHALHWVRQHCAMLSFFWLCYPPHICSKNKDAFLIHKTLMWRRDLAWWVSFQKTFECPLKKSSDAKISLLNRRWFRRNWIV